MPRMSCSMTTAQVYDRTKTVTRRHIGSWWRLKPGDRLTLIEKGMGLPKGAKQVVITTVEVVSVTVEPIGAITADECAREGLGHMTPAEFVEFWLAGHGYSRARGFDGNVLCRRIEWRYLE